MKELIRPNITNEDMVTLEQIRQVIEDQDSLVEYYHGREHCILPEHYDELAMSIYGLINSENLEKHTNKHDSVMQEDIIGK